MAKCILPVLINREAGVASDAGDKLPDLVSQAFAAADGEADIQMLAARRIEKAIESVAAKHKRFVVGGGDGTVASAAQLLTGTKTELAILPLGTLNHFARDLGIPVDLAEAVKLAIGGKAGSVDVGEVNGRRFINSASVGLYPLMVRNRNNIRERRGWPKWWATVLASWAALSRLRYHRLRIDMGRGEEPVTTALLFVGNNHYSLASGSIGSRDSLSDGKLSVYAVAREGRLALLWLGVRAVIGMMDREQDFQTLGDAESLSVRSPDRSLEIALDGEVQRLKLPLEFGIHPGGLSVVIPSNIEDARRRRQMMRL